MKKIEEEEFVLRPTMSPSDKEFRARIGEESWMKLKSSAFRSDSFKCVGCGFQAFDTEPDKVLDIHLIKENLDSPEESEIRTTCVFCHLVEHADAAIAGGYVELVNSHFSQSELVNICRNESLAYHIEIGDVRSIKKTFAEYLEELRDGRAFEGKVKLIFTDKFTNGLS